MNINDIRGHAAVLALFDELIGLESMSRIAIALVMALTTPAMALSSSNTYYVGVDTANPQMLFQDRTAETRHEIDGNLISLKHKRRGQCVT